MDFKSDIYIKRSITGLTKCPIDEQYCRYLFCGGLIIEGVIAITKKVIPKAASRYFQLGAKNGTRIRNNIRKNNKIIPNKFEFINLKLTGQIRSKKTSMASSHIQGKMVMSLYF